MLRLWVFYFYFFKQKTAYDMRISDWSSDVCSSDLCRPGMDLDDFRTYWKNVHGPLASGITAIRRYEQDHLARTENADGSQPVLDGLAVTWFDSTESMKQGAKTPVYAETRADEANFLPDGHLPFVITTEHEIVPLV